MARASSGLAYPERFYAAASYAGFGGGSPNPSSEGAISKFQNDVALLLYGLHQQATVGPCNVPKPRAWNPVENSKWTSWNGLGNMASTEAMRLFVKILEEEDPSWYSRVPEFVVEPVVDIEMNTRKLESVTPNGNLYPEPKTISTENGSIETEDKDVVLEGLGSVGIYDQWVAPSVSGQRPKARYEHGAALIQEKMYIFGGNHNGRYLNDLQVLDLRSLTWSKVEAKVEMESLESSSPVPLAPCAGHSLISWGKKLLSIAGHTKDPSETVTVKEFDTQTCTWSNLKTYGKAPVSRGGQTVTLVGTSLVMFGGEDAKRSLLNDLHILDLETLTWDEIDAVGAPPSPRSDHAAAVHADRYLLIFGGGSHATCFNDLHVLDLHNMEWSRPTQQGEIPTPRAGHAGVTVGENWFIVGGGDNKIGVSETVVLNMSTLVWSVVTTVQGRVPLASEGLSLVVSSYNGEDILVSFGGYNGKYNHEVHVLKPSHKSTLQTKIVESPVPDSVAAIIPATNVESEFEAVQDGRIREIVMDNADSEPVNIKSEETNERLIAALKADKEEMETALTMEQLQSLQLKQQLAEAETRNTDLTKASFLELQSVRGQLAAEQSRCFKLEVDVAELRQKLQTMDTLQKELELLQRQKAASEQAALLQKQKSSGGVWGWLAGSPPDRTSDA
ncbi:acyl-CoA-binding domain-containing protein 4-like protein isoform X2 [Cinnamomum micranthum f. kanehirae]|uniref:Acyl-CoA-binding domain-containing protein 4-like protein isoform X2 n=1 Tax=Cinnamomum micranthum f. kanehirae TaxID=337451 RepID=A0A3S3MX51_9MAGN|nr:acyl-CoA-binding domain-containing protein 4-like protein isoform X2 [Cinnamomum micranthum f. kanehirae]